MNEGAIGDELLEVILPSEINIADWELIEDGKPYREWCVPAALLNERATARLLARTRPTKRRIRAGALSRMVSKRLAFGALTTLQASNYGSTDASVGSFSASR